MRILRSWRFVLFQVFSRFRVHLRSRRARRAQRRHSQHRRHHQRHHWRLESLEARNLMSANPIYAIPENQSLYVDVSAGILSSANNPDGMTHASLSANAQHGSANVDDAGSFSYSPTSSYSGDDTFDVNESNDDGSATETVTVTIHVVAPPQATDFSADLGSNGQITGNLFDHATVDPNDSLSLALVNGSSYSPGYGPQNFTTSQGGTVQISDNGDFVYAPGTNVGADTFTFGFSDPLGTRTNSATATLNIPTPQASDFSQNVVEDQSSSGNLFAHISIAPNDSLQLSGIANQSYTPGNGAQTFATDQGNNVTVNDDGSFTFDSNGFTGTDSFNFTVVDPSNYSATGTAHFTVTPPIELTGAPNDNQGQGQSLTDSLANYFTGSNGAVSYVVASQPITANNQVISLANGNLAVNLDGSFQFTPNSSFAGQQSFDFTISDTAGSNASGTAVLNVVAAPFASDTTLGMAVNSSSEKDGNFISDNLTLTWANASITAHVNGQEYVLGTGSQSFTLSGGTLSINDDGSYSYLQSNNGFTGQDSFSFTATDQFGNSATGQINFLAVAPTAASFSGTLVENNQFTGNLLIHGTAIDGDSLSVSLIGTASFTSTGDPQDFDTAQGGTVAVSPNGDFVYTPPANWYGSDSFSYTLMDSYGATATGTVSLAVTNPLSASDFSTNLYANHSTSSLNLFGHVSNVQGYTVSLSAMGTSSYTPGNGTQTFVTDHNGTIAVNDDGSFVYTPASDWSGTDQISYSVTDSVGNSASANVQFQVAPIPVANGFSATLNSDGTLSGNVLNHVTVPTSDSVVLSAISGVNFTAGAGSQTFSLSQGTLVIAGNGQFTYTPAVNTAGEASFSYTVIDLHGNLATGDVTLGVPVPQAQDFGQSVGEGKTVSGNLLNHVTHAANDTVSVGMVNGQAVSNSTTTITDDAGNQLTVHSDGSYVYHPNGTDFGIFQITVTDPSGHEADFNAEFSVVARPELTNSHSDGAGYGQSIQDNFFSYISSPDYSHLQVSVNDHAVTTDNQVITTDHGSLTVNLNGEFTYTASTGYSGSDVAHIVCQDSYGNSVTFYANFYTAPQPQATSRDYQLVEHVSGTTWGNYVTDTHFQQTGGSLVATIDGQTFTPGNGPQTYQLSFGTLTLADDGSYQYELRNNELYGQDSFSYTVTDPYGLSATGTATFTVLPALVAQDHSYTLPSGGLLQVDLAGQGLLTGLIDRANLNSPQLSVAIGPAHGTVSLNDDGTFAYQAAPGATGTDEFQFVVTEGSLVSAQATVSIALHADEHAPVAPDLTYRLAPGSTLSMNSPSTGLLGSATDADGDYLSVSLYGAMPPHGALHFDPDGTWNYTPANGFVGTDRFQYQVTDGSQTSLGTVTLKVSNATPLDSDQFFQGIGGQAVEGAILPSYYDGQATSLAITTPPANGSLTLNQDGTFSYLATTGFTGLDTFCYQATNARGAGTIGTVTINVLPVETDYPTIQYGSTYSGYAQGDPGTFSVLTPPSAGSVQVDDSGSYQFTPAATGLYTFTIRGAIDLGYDGTSERYQDVDTVVSLVVTAQSPVVATGTFAGLAGETISADAAHGVLAKASDPLGLTLNAGLLALPAHGSLQFSHDGSFTYTPDPDFAGTDSFQYRIWNGYAYADGTATLAVIQGIPTITATSDTQSAITGSSVVFSAANNNLISVGDEAVDALQVTLTVNQGTLQLAADANVTGLTVTPSSDQRSLTIVGPQAGINQALQGLIYTGSALGADQLSIELSDRGLSLDQMLHVSTASISLLTQSAGPQFTGPDSLNVNQGASLALAGDNAVTVHDADVSSLNVTLSATFGTLTLSSVIDSGLTVQHANGDKSLILSGDQTLINEALSSLVYTPTATYAGADRINILADDSGASADGIDHPAYKSINVTVVATGGGGSTGSGGDESEQPPSNVLSTHWIFQSVTVQTTEHGASQSFNLLAGEQPVGDAGTSYTVTISVNPKNASAATPFTVTGMGDPITVTGPTTLTQTFAIGNGPLLIECTLTPTAAGSDVNDFNQLHGSGSVLDMITINPALSTPEQPLAITLDQSDVEVNWDAGTTTITGTIANADGQATLSLKLVKLDTNNPTWGVLQAPAELLSTKTVVNGSFSFDVGVPVVGGHYRAFITAIDDRSTTTAELPISIAGSIATQYLVTVNPLIPSAIDDDPYTYGRFVATTGEYGVTVNSSVAGEIVVNWDDGSTSTATVNGGQDNVLLHTYASLQKSEADSGFSDYEYRPSWTFTPLDPTASSSSSQGGIDAFHFISNGYSGGVVTTPTSFELSAVSYDTTASLPLQVNGETIINQAAIQFSRLTTWGTSFAGQGPGNIALAGSTSSEAGDVTLHFRIVRTDPGATDDSSTAWSVDSYQVQIASGSQLSATSYLTAVDDGQAHADRHYNVLITDATLTEGETTLTETFDDTATPVASLTILGNDPHAVFGSNNVDTEETGLARDTVFDSVTGDSISLYDGTRTWNIPSSLDGLATFRDQGNTSSVYNVLDPLPPSGSDQSIPGRALTGRDSDYAAIGSTSPTGATLVRGFAGAADVSSSYDPNPTYQSWTGEYVDRLVGVDQLGASVGATPQSGFLLLRSDGTNAWFNAASYDVAATASADVDLPPHYASPQGADYSTNYAQANATSWTLTGLDPSRVYQVVFASQTPDTWGNGAGNYTLEKGTPYFTETFNGGVGPNGQTLLEVPLGTPSANLPYTSFGYFMPDQNGEIKLSAWTTFTGVLQSLDSWTFTTPDGSLADLQSVNGYNGDDSIQFVLQLNDGVTYAFNQYGLLVSTTDANSNTTQYQYDSIIQGMPPDRLSQVQQANGTTVTFNYASGHELASIAVKLAGAESSRVVSFSGGMVFGPLTGNEVNADSPSEQFRAPMGRPAIRPDVIEDAPLPLAAEVGSFLINVDGWESSGEAAAAPNEQIGDLTDTAAELPQAYATYQPEHFANQTAATWKYQTDRFGLTTAVASPATNNNGENVVITRRATQTGRVTDILTPVTDDELNPDGITSSERSMNRTTIAGVTYDITHFDYTTDGNNRVTELQITNPDGTKETSDYNPQFNVVTQYTDSLGNVTQDELDSHGNVIAEEVGSNAALGVAFTELVRYTYTTAAEAGIAGQIKTVSDAKQVTTYEYYGMGEDVPVGSRGQVKSKTTAANTNTDFLTNGGPGIASPTDQIEESYTYDQYGNLASSTNEFGSTTNYTYDPLGQLLEVRSVDANNAAVVTKYTYDAAGNEHSVVTPGSTPTSTRTTTYVYDALNRLVKEIEPVVNGQQATTTYTYTADSQIATTTDANGNQESNLYNQRGELYQSQLPPPNVPAAAQATTVTVYDALGRVEQTTDAVGRVTQYKYDWAGRVVKEIQPGGDASQSNLVRRYVYDAAGRETDVFSADGATAPDGSSLTRRTHEEYYTDGQLRSETTDVNTSLADQTTYAYDAVGNLETETAHANSAQFATTKYVYDYLNRVIEVDQSDKDDNTKLLRISTTAYSVGNAKNQIVTTTYRKGDQSTNPDANPSSDVSSDSLPPLQGLQTVDTYNQIGQLAKEESKSEVDTSGNRTTISTMLYGYNSAGEQTSSQIVSSSGTILSETTDRYNARGQLIIETIADNSAAKNTTLYGYNAAGNRIKVVDSSGNITDFTFNYLGEVTSETNEANVNNPEIFIYDAVGRLTDSYDYDHRHAHYTYNALDEVLTETDTSGSGTLIASTTNTYDVAGQLRTTTHTAGGFTDITTLGYDVAGNVKSETLNGSFVSQFIDPAANVTLNQESNSQGERTALAVNINQATTDLRNSYTYDNLGQLTKITQTGQTSGTINHGVTAKTVKITYRDDGQRATLSRYAAADVVDGSLVANTNYGYDSAGRLASVAHQSSSSTTLESYSLGYNALQLIESITQQSTGTTSYIYDESGQLKSVTGPGAGGSGSATYNYDPTGNRASPDVFGNNNELVSDGTYKYDYDNSGNLIKQTPLTSNSTSVTTSYTWDAHHHLLEAVQKNNSNQTIADIKYDYDSFGRLVGRDEISYKTASGSISTSPQNWTRTGYLYDGDNILLAFQSKRVINGVSQSDLSPHLVQRNLWGDQPDELLAQESLGTNLSQAGTDSWDLADWQGSIRTTVNDSGTVTARVNYDAFGNVINAVNGSGAAITNVASQLPFLYTGKFRDAVTGLQYNNARWYDPRTGRWLSVDPIGFAGGDSNLYRYVNNDPVNGTDPSGLAEAGSWEEAIATTAYYGAWINPGTSLAMASNWFWGKLTGAMSSSNNESIQFAGTVGGQLIDKSNSMLVGMSRVDFGPRLVAMPITISMDTSDDIDFLYDHKREGIWTSTLLAGANNFPLTQPFVSLTSSITGTNYNTRDHVGYGTELPATNRTSNLIISTGEIGLMGLSARSALTRNAPTQMNPLKAGVDFEARQLAELGLPKNTTVWRPTVEQTQSAAFKVIVGEAKYTKGGVLKGTILDATDAGFVELKGGSSVLESSYQLRLQTYRSLIEGQPYTIRTTRPINPTFQDWLQRWGVKVERP